ncbi:MAG TPA: hypothetical protein DC048_07455, partial [Planctomycetaceae bacterium]|nr:hypothetical protein [Planctomycetaceae bacterium]
MVISRRRAIAHRGAAPTPLDRTSPPRRGGNPPSRHRLSAVSPLSRESAAVSPSRSASAREPVDVLLIGSGIMSASLAALLKCLEPRLSIRVLEVTPDLAREASDGWNNAGTGHAGLCELSYTPAREPDGSIRIERTLSIFEQFEHSRQFWAHAVRSGMVGPPARFIHAVPHVCFVQGRDDVDFLVDRYEAL